jgi:predicted DNA-binding transcriptional regulator AlpA
MSNIPAAGFLRLRQIIGDDNTPAIIPIKKSSWWQGVKDGRYPQPVKLGPRTTAWRADDIRALVDRLGRAA